MYVKTCSLSSRPVGIARMFQCQPFWIYAITLQEDGGGPLKIGKSKDPLGRVKNLQSASPYPLHLKGVGCSAVFSASKVPYYPHVNSAVEKDLHDHYKDRRMQGEWFDLTYDQLVRETSDYTCSSCVVWWSPAEWGRLQQKHVAALVKAGNDPPPKNFP